MNQGITRAIALMSVAAAITSACGSSESPGDVGTTNPDANVSSGDSGSDATGGDLGSATLTIGDESWQFDSFGCAFGHEATQSEVYSFSSNSFGEHSTGARVQMQADIRDETGQGRYEGEGVIYEIFIDDIEDFENPSVSWEASNSRSPENAVITLDGDRVTAEGLFDDGRTGLELEEVPGTLEGTCGSQSIR